MVVKHADGTYSGFSVHSTSTGNSDVASDIFSTNKQGLLFQFGCLVKLLGVRVQVTKTGAPGSLTARVYENSTEKYSTPAYSNTFFTNSDFIVLLFNSPTYLSPNTPCYVIFEQDGASDSDDYDIDGLGYNSTYKTTAMPSNSDFVFGSGSDPTAFALEVDFLPYIQLVISDMQKELSGKSILFDATLYDLTDN